MKQVLVVLLFGLVAIIECQQYRFSQPNNQYNSDLGRAAILRNTYLNDGHGNYDFSYETDNGISAMEHASQMTLDDKVVRGSYSYTGDDGQVYTVTYYADATGFHPMGDHIPGSHGVVGTGSTTSYNKKPAYNQQQQYQKPQTHKPQPHKPQPQKPKYQQYQRQPTSGYNYQTPPKTKYLPPSTNYLPPHYRY